MLQSVEIDRCAGHILYLDSSEIPLKYCNCQILPSAFQWKLVSQIPIGVPLTETDPQIVAFRHHHSLKSLPTLYLASLCVFKYTIFRQYLVDTQYIFLKKYPLISQQRWVKKWVTAAGY